jgi:FkbM family methyltransferase
MMGIVTRGNSSYRRMIAYHFGESWLGYEMLTRIRKFVLNRIARRKYAPGIKVENRPNLRRLGSFYGGWMLEPSSDLEHATIVSCGLGEDASFDVEFAAAFDATVIIVDPTPRAIAHFTEMRTRLGQPALSAYSKGGKQPATAYDLGTVSADSLVLEPSAIWIENTRLKFYAPRNSASVSHSIVNLHNSSSQDASYIEVTAMTLESVLQKYGLTSIPLLKLDIEGAEGKVIENILGKRIYPRQLLVEFDDMVVPSERAKKSSEATDQLLRKAGYTCCFFDGLCSFLYMRS